MVFFDTLHISALADAAGGPSNIGVYLTFVLGVFGVAATAFGVYTTYKSRQRELKMQAQTTQIAVKQQEMEERSVTFEQMNDAIPGLGELVKLYQGQAKEALLDSMNVRKEMLENRHEYERRQLADHLRIVELEGQVRALTDEVVTLKRKNNEQEDRIIELTRRRNE